MKRHLVSGFVLAVFVLLAFGSMDSSEQKPAPQAPQVVLSTAPWTAPAPWTTDLLKLIKNPSSRKAVGKTRDEDVLLYTYDFGAFQSGANGTLARYDGKPKAWRWQYASKGVSPTDIASAGDLEELFKSETHEVWYRVKSGPFENDYVGYRSSYLPEQALLTIETPEYSEADNETALQPWLCGHNRIGGTHPVSEGELMARCQELVRENLKAPSTAEFQGLFDGIERPTWLGNCNQEWESWVEAKNAFGVPLRKKFTCSYNTRNTTLRVRLHE